MKIRVVLADDHAMVRTGLRSLLEATGDISVVAEAETGTGALEAIAREKPDVAVLDVSMPELGGIEAAEIVHESDAGVRVLMLSGSADIESVHRALRAGAAGYVPKFAAGTELVEAIRRVHAGRRYLAASISEAMADRYAAQLREKSPLESLSRRERQVLQMLAEGRSVPDIAAIIAISPRTVETYRSRLYDKLGLADMRELILFAAKEGLVSAR